MCRILEDMRKESLEEGRIEGRIEGKLEGRMEGLRESAINTAKKLITDGTLPIDKIAEFVGLSLEETTKLKVQDIS